MPSFGDRERLVAATLPAFGGFPVHENERRGRRTGVRMDDRIRDESAGAPGPAAWVERIRRHGGKVLAYLARRFPWLEESDRHDILVDAMIAFDRTYDANRGEEGPWLLLLAHQQVVQRWRSDRRRRLGLPLVTLDEGECEAEDRPPRSTLEQDELAEAVRVAMEGLAPVERAVIEADLEAGGTAEAEPLAAKLGVTRRAVYAARARARDKLARWLEEWAPQGD